MTYDRWMSKEELHQKVPAIGYKKSKERTETATFWENENRRVIQVPDPDENGMYSPAKVRIVESYLGIELTSH